MHSFESPAKLIRTIDDMKIWEKSEAYYVSLSLFLNNVKLHALCEVINHNHVSNCVLGVKCQKLIKSCFPGILGLYIGYK